MLYTVLKFNDHLYVVLLYNYVGMLEDIFAYF